MEPTMPLLRQTRSAAAAGSYQPHPLPKSQEEQDEEQAHLTFRKTLDGHYRHGKPGYERVGALFLTWQDDDMQCKTTEVVI